MNRLRNLLRKYKFKAATASAAAIVLIAGIILWNSGPKTELAPAAAESPTPPAVSPDPSTVNGSPTLQAVSPISSAVKDTPTPLPAPASSFTFAACPSDVVIHPKPDRVPDSGYKPLEQPARPPLSGIRQISAGQLNDDAGYGMKFGSSYALSEDNTVYRWGIYRWDSGTRPPAYPVKVTGLPGTVKQLEGRYVLLENGDVYDLIADRGTPRKIAGLKDIVSIAQAKDMYVYAVDRDGGLQLYSLYGPGDKPSLNKVDGLPKIRTITAGPYIAIANDYNGTQWRVPSPFGYENPSKGPSILKLPDNETVTRIDVTFQFQSPAYLLTDKGNWYRMNETGLLQEAVVPEDTVQIAGATEATFALLKNGTVRAWGTITELFSSEQGPVAPESAKQVDGLEGITALSAGSDHLLALTEEGKILTLGSNMYGQLGRLPVYAESPQTIGQWPGVEALFPVYGQTFAVKNGGDVWSLSWDGTVKPILLGQKVSKAMTAFGHYAFLTKDGRLLAAQPKEQQDSCRELLAPQPIVDAAAAGSGMLLSLKDGKVIYAEGDSNELIKKTELRFDPQPAGKVTRVYAEPIPLVLTDKGELYFQSHRKDGVPVMEPVGIRAAIQEYSPLHYVFLDGIGYIGKAIDNKGFIYEVSLNLNRTDDTATAEITNTGQKAELLAGGASISSGNRIREQLPYDSGSIDTRLPADAKLRSSASFYHYPIEGRAFFYHLFVTEDGTIYWLGDTPFIGTQTTPGYAG